MYAVAPLFRRAVVVAALTLAAGIPGARATEPAVADTPASLEVPADLWLTRLDVNHKMLFDSPDPNGGVGLAHMHNFYDAYNRSYGVRDSDIRGVFTFYGRTTLYAVNDAMWAKYHLGEMLDTEDPATGDPAMANPWRANLVYRGRSIPGASIEAMQRRGAIFLVCDYALQVFAGMMAQANGLDPVAVYEELKANVLPDVEIVPSMIISIEQAHRAGLAYQRK